MKPYQPDALPLAGLDHKRLFALVGDANAELARYDALLQATVNSAILLSPLTNEEAVLSSRIEGTQATVDEVLEQEAGMVKEGDKYEDIQEIINYREALRQGRDYLRERPITLAFVRELHRMLMSSVRGKDKNPGEFRKDQNWIGKAGCTLAQATFVPPSPLQLNDHLQAWQAYVEAQDIDALVQTAVVHAQFELLHPFKDGNGRIGRLLIPLFLYQKNKLSQPMFYLSSYLERNRDEYYLGLQEISRSGDWNGWIEFFLGAVLAQARENNAKASAILQLYESMKTAIHNATHSQYGVQLLDFIFDKPIFRTSDFAVAVNVHKPTATRLLSQLKRAGILKVIRPGRGRRASVLAFSQLLNIAEGKEIL